MAVLKNFGLIALAAGIMVLAAGCSHDDANAPVANPAGRVPEAKTTTSDTPHGAKRDLKSMTMSKSPNPTAAPEPGSKAH